MIPSLARSHAMAVSLKNSYCQSVNSSYMLTPKPRPGLSYATASADIINETATHYTSILFIITHMWFTLNHALNICDQVWQKGFYHPRQEVQHKYKTSYMNVLLDFSVRHGLWILVCFCWLLILGPLAIRTSSLEYSWHHGSLSSSELCACACQVSWC